MDEQEWTPILYQPCPGCTGPKAKRWNSAINKGKKIVRVKPTSDRSDRYVCGAERFFQVHPEDAERFWGCTIGRMFICEHKILSAD